MTDTEPKLQLGCKLFLFNDNKKKLPKKVINRYRVMKNFKNSIVYVLIVMCYETGGECWTCSRNNTNKKKQIFTAGC